MLAALARSADRLWQHGWSSTAACPDLSAASIACSGGTLGGILPLLAVFYAVMLRSWTRAVDDLAEHYDPSHAHRMSVAGSLDEDDVAGVLPPVAVGGGPDGDDYGGAAASAPGRTPTPAY